ncbi:hypothetical protein ILUMI_20078 [Ignelater luminosus]|uniref:Uncharacterized protein n=1 Tax=Ignelater luminosus TaxID=2038154 RepID=A0A8K0FZ96_IGNLU|nr:hypothetical protein ILUMI_20078 [Ignelater luminosus]
MKIKLLLFFLLSLNAFTFVVVALKAEVHILTEVKKTYTGGSDSLVCHYNIAGPTNHGGKWNFTVTVDSKDNKNLDYIPFSAKMHCILESNTLDLTINTEDRKIEKEIAVMWKKPLTNSNGAVCKANQAKNSSNYGPTFSVVFECSTQKLPKSVVKGIEELKSVECDGVLEYNHK